MISILLREKYYKIANITLNKNLYPAQYRDQRKGSCNYRHFMMLTQILSVTLKGKNLLTI